MPWRNSANLSKLESLFKNPAAFFALTIPNHTCHIFMFLLFADYECRVCLADGPSQVNL